MFTIRPDLAALALRLVLGSVLLAHSLLKVFVFTLPGTAGFFASVGFPSWAAYVVTPIEFACGLALLVGFQSRISSAVCLPILLGALFVHSGNGWLFTNANGGWEYPAVLVFLAVCVIFAGNGAHSVQRPAPSR